jgi:hypothetical protein
MLASKVLVALLGLAFAFWAPHLALGQGFQVKPMTMQFSVDAGRVAQTTLDLTNTSGEPLTLDIYTTELTQSPTGSWLMANPEDADGLSSAREWVTVQQSQIQIPPATLAEIPIQFTVPASARGTYLAAIIAEQPTPEGAEGLIVRVRFLIPVIIQIKGRPVRQNIRLTEVGMNMIEATENDPATTTLTMQVANEGKTFSRVRGELTLQVESAGNWRTLTRSEITERGIIPGVTLELPADIERRLPSGNYRLRAELYVDGRRVAPIEKDVAFVGDPEIDEIAFDTALLLEPAVVDMQVVPGATRTTILTIVNPGEEPVNVSLVSDTPKALAGVVMGELVGTSLSAQPWTQIMPAKFTLRPGRRQNVRVVSRIPREGADYPNYYADLVVQGIYDNGQSAGETRSTVHLRNIEVDSVPSAFVEQFALSESEQPGQFTAQVRLVNTGNVHVEPAPRLILLTSRGEEISRVELTGEPGMLLPLGLRTYGGELNLSSLEPGLYVLRAQFPLSTTAVVTDQHLLLLEPGEVTEADGDVVPGPKVTLDPEGAEVEVEQLPAVPPEEQPAQESAG